MFDKEDQIRLAEVCANTFPDSTINVVDVAPVYVPKEGYRKVDEMSMVGHYINGSKVVLHLLPF